MLCVQRFAASSLFKRTIYQHIAEELLAAGHAASPAVSCPIDSRARPLITLPTESPLQRLFTSLDFEDEAVDRHKLAAGLQRLGGAPYAMQCNAMQCTRHVVSNWLQTKCQEKLIAGTAITVPLQSTSLRSPGLLTPCVTSDLCQCGVWTADPGLCYISLMSTCKVPAPRQCLDSHS